MSIQETLERIRKHQRAIQALERKESMECDCPLETDPYGTGDTDYTVRICQRWVCVEDETAEEDDSDEPA